MIVTALLVTRAGCGHRSLTTGDAAVLHWAGWGLGGGRAAKSRDGEIYHHFVLHQTVDTGPSLHHTPAPDTVIQARCGHGDQPRWGTGFPGMINGQEP